MEQLHNAKRNAIGTIASDPTAPSQPQLPWLQSAATEANTSAAKASAATTSERLAKATRSVGSAREHSSVVRKFVNAAAEALGDLRRMISVSQN
jgi:hypothetical protein